MARVAIVIPNYVLRGLFGDPTAPPLGAALVAAALREAGHEVSMIDADAEDLAPGQVLERLESRAPDAVGISCNYISKHNPTLLLAREIKQRVKCLVFVGGNHASAEAENLLASSGGAIDVVLRGEGEPTAPLLMGSLDRKAPLDSRSLEPRHVEALDRLPLPAYDLLPMARYTRFAVLTSRGCPYGCSFCASNLVAGPRVRLRSPESVAEEVRLLRACYGERFLWLADDTFTAVPRHARAIAAALGGLSQPVKWSCMTSTTALSQALLGAMQKGGCEYVSIGVESTHPDHKRFMGKPVSDEGVFEAVRLIRDAGMRVYAFFIIGFPGETWDAVHHRVRLIERARFDGVAVNLLIPLPGTELWDMLVRSGALDPAALDRDRLFARFPSEELLANTARLVSNWTQLSAQELLDACAQCRAAAQSE